MDGIASENNSLLDDARADKSENYRDNFVTISRATRIPHLSLSREMCTSLAYIASMIKNHRAFEASHIEGLCFAVAIETGISRYF